ncbi:CLUMA_CG015274, isoform A [Clunio marinus]|uniref:CLUMA_CG015274, isoform A n=1 Tax=Clunio marinus TaxID=568069 RepID=A0A1J1IQ16_9DIPT|nr:CLUMA_CG015274, isoform A [Clunio marinus]
MTDLITTRVQYAVVIGISIIMLWKLLKKRPTKNIPKKWKKVGELSDLMCFPIKSGGVVRSDEFDCINIGLQKNYIRDRTFMVVNSSGEFITARAHPKLVQVAPYVDNDYSVMILSAPDMSNINIDVAQLSTLKPKKAVVWGEAVDAIDAGDDAARWFSQFILGKESGLRLVFYPASYPTRDVREKNKVFKSAVPADTGALHDATSFMLINESSIEELNSRVEKYVTPLQFRPNFVVKEVKPYEEDSWKWIKIGEEAVFENVKPCTRCIFTNIDPITAERNSNEEPLKTLKTYRKFENCGDSPVMGIHLGLRRKGVIRLNDPIYIEEN